MKTLQEQYILIKEGKGNKDHFLKQAKNLFPEYINQYSSYDSTVSVLKSKSILTEGIGGVISHQPSKSWMEIFRENTSNEAVDMTSAADGPFGQAVGMIKRNGGAKLLNDKNITRAIDLFNALKSGDLKKSDLDVIMMADGKKFTETGIFTQDIAPLLNTNEADVLGTPMSDLSFGSKVKVGDNAMMGDDKVEITLVDRVNGKIKLIKGKTEDGRELEVTKPMLLRPVKEETLSSQSDLSFGSKVKVGDKAMIGDDKVTITLVDRVNGKIKQIKGKTEDGEELFVTKPMLLRPVKEETLSEIIGVKKKKTYGDYDEFEKPTKEVADALAHQFNDEDKKNIDNVYGTSFLNGYYAEMKDPKNKNKTVDELKQIVLKNMVKDINYYAKNAMFGTKGVGFKTSTETIAPKGKYKSSGYGDLDKKKK